MKGPQLTSASLGRDHRRWILVNALAIAALINLAINAGIAWATTAGERSIPLASIPVVQRPSTLTTTLGTLFILPFVTTISVSAAVHRDRQAGRLTDLELEGRHAWLLRRMPTDAGRQAVVFGLACLAILGPPAAIILLLTDPSGVSRLAFVVYSTVLAVVLGLLVTPILAAVAMASRGRA
jgi:hypothetical protein